MLAAPLRPASVEDPGVDRGLLQELLRNWIVNQPPNWREIEPAFLEPRERGILDELAADDQVVDGPPLPEFPTPGGGVAVTPFEKLGQHRTLLQQALEFRLRVLRAACELDAAQVRKLKLAGTGDIERGLNRTEAAYQSYIHLIVADFPRAWPDILQIINWPQTKPVDPFGPGSLFDKTLEKNLSFGQARNARLLATLEGLRGQVELASDSRGENYVLKLNEETMFDVLVAVGKDWGRLRGLNLAWTPVTESDLEQICRLPYLERLYLGGTQIRDESLAHLRGLGHLTTLDVRRTPITDAGLAHIGHFRGLRRLNLGRTRITGAGLVHLRPLRQLSSLICFETAVQDGDLQHLSELTDLEELNLDRTGISDAGVEHLAPLVRLQYLGLAGTKVTDAALERLGEFPGLESVDLFRTHVSSSAAAVFQKERPDVLVLR